MELTHLRYFMAVAEELHFGRAAKRLNISQPPLSMQIRKLEEELEVELFRRTSRVVELTPAGEQLLEEARIIVGRADHALERMRAIAAGQQGKFGIGYNEPALNTFLPGALKRFRRKYPEVEVKLAGLTYPEQLDALDRGEIALGFCRPYHRFRKEFKTRMIFRENYQLVLPAGHPLCGETTVPLEKLNGEQLISFSRNMNPELFDDILAILESHGAHPTVCQEATGKAAVLALVRAGMGVAIVPESCIGEAAGGVVRRALEPGLPPVEIFAVWNPVAPGWTTRFLSLLP